jgi:enoyl-[acyl-carrier-protein] reductase (NADH)
VDDVTDAALAMISPLFRQVTGAVLPVDSGLTMS